MKPKRTNHVAQMRAEYNFDYSKAVRGKYYKRYMENSNVVVLDPDVHRRFKNAKAVNEALRSLMQGKRTRRDLTKRSTRTRAKAARAGKAGR